MNARDTANADPTLRGMAEPTPLADALLLTGAANGCWHAITPDPPSATSTDPVTGPPTAGRSICGLWVKASRSHGVFDRSRWSRNVCPTCVWTLAVRAGVGAVGSEATRWPTPPPSRWAACSSAWRSRSPAPATTAASSTTTR